MKNFYLTCFFIFSLGSLKVYGQCPPPGFPQPGDVCAQAPVICANLDDYCATLGSNNVQQPFPGCGGNVLNNDEWFGFIAGTTTITIEVIPSNCQGTFGQFGMQAAIYEGGCTGPAVATQCTCETNPFQLNSSSFIVGQAYYVVFDGCGGDICDFQVNVLQGSTLPVPPSPPTAILGTTQVCPGSTLDYNVPNPNAATFDWSIVPPSLGVITSANPGAPITINWTGVGAGQLCVTASNPCFPPTAPFCIPINSQTIPQQHQYYDICIGDCEPCAGQTFCAPTPPSGTPVTLTSWLGCDSVIVCHMTGVPPINNNIGQVTMCGPATYSVCGTNYTTSGINSTTCTNWQGCDSTVIVDLAIFQPNANISPPPVLGCGSGSTVQLSGINSTYDVVPNGSVTFLWAGPGIVGPNNQINVTVNLPGQYCLTVTNSRANVTCSNTECVTVTQNNAVPQQPQISGNMNPCQGTTVNYTVTPVGTPAATGYTWTTPNGEPFTVVNSTTIAVTWNSSTGGNLCVTADNGCGSSTPACIAITVGASPIVPIVTGPASVCANSTPQTYSVTNPQSGVTYNWQVPPGASFSGSGTSINVNFSGASLGSAQVCVTAQNSCGTSQPGCADLTITSPPIVPALSGPSTVCSSGGQYTYNVTNPQAGSTYNWTAPNGAMISGSGASVTIDFNGASSGQVCVSTTNGCGTSSQTCQSVQVIAAPTANISGSGAFCQGSGGSVNLSVTLTGAAPWNVIYTYSGGSPDTISVSSSPYTLTVSNAGTYTLVSVTGANNCSGTVSGSAVVTEHPSPTATLSGSGSICQGSGQTVPLNINFTGTAPWTVNWNVGSNPQAPFIGNSNPDTLNIGQSQAGNITLTGVTDGNGCIGSVSGSSTVTVNTAPTVSMVQTPCDATNTTYTVSFTISGGDPSSYSVTPNNGTLSNGVFTSNPIPGGTGYSFVVTDVNNCNPVTISQNTVICNCTTTAGSTSLTPVEECGDGPVSIPYDSAHVFDGNDVLVFILHSGNSVSIVPPIAGEFSSPDVTFNPATMTYGTTYYFSAVVGDDDGAGSVDLNDPCLDVAQGTSVTFYEIPTATLSGSPAVCEGDPASLSVEFTGDGPWSISFDDGSGNVQTVNGINSNPYTLVVNPTSTTTYCLTAMNDTHCAGTVSGCGTATVNTGVQVSGLDVACNGTSTAFTVSFTINGGDPASYSVTGATGTISGSAPYIFTSDPIPTGSGFSITVDDANGCDPQTVSQTQVICDCTTDAGQMDSNPFNECGDGPANIADATGTMFDGDDILMYVLHTNPGSTLGTIIASGSTPVFSFDSGTMSYGVTYYVSSVVGSDDGSGAIDLMDPCLSIAPGTPLTFYEIPTATLSGGKEICPGDSADLMVELTGDSPWSVTINGQVINNIVNSPYIYTVNPATTTVFDLTDVSDEHCSNTITDSETITVHVPPTIANVVETCNPTNTAFTVCFDIMDGDASCYQVTPNGILNGNQYCSSPIPTGQGYNFSVTDCHGCPAVTTQSPLVICNCTTDAGDMDAAPLTVCGNGMAVATHILQGDTLDADDVLCFMLHNGDFNPIATNSSPQFSFNLSNMTYGQQYFICAVVGNDAGNGCADFNDPCLSISNVCTPVTFYATPTATLSGGGDICMGESINLSVMLTGAAPWTIVYQNAAGNPVTVTANSSPHTLTVSPSSSNVYSLTSVQNAFCPGTVSGNAIVNVNQPPQIVNLNTTCDLNTQTYTVTFEIVGGDATTYSVSPAGILSNGTYTSTPISSGQPYTFQVDDANGCGPTTVTDVVLCNCGTEAGSMPQTTVQNFCVDETAMVLPAVGTMLDSTDVLVYVLHTNSGNMLGTQLATNSTPSFNFDPATMTTGTQYYISAYAGNNNGLGGVSSSDPCRDVAPGTPIIFRPLPTISISGTTSICEGGSANLTLTVTGTGPSFNVNYLENGVQQNILIPAPGSFPVTLTPAATTTLTLVSITDVSTGCTNTSSQSATITVNPQPEAGASLGDLTFCENTGGVIDLNAQISGADPGGQWTGLGGTSIPGGSVNSNSLAAGTYTYTYTVTGTAPCPNDSVSLDIVIHQEPVANAGSDKLIDCDHLDAALGSNETTAGATYLWTGGNVSDPSIMQPVTTEGGTYTLTVTTSFGCTATDEVTVDVNKTTPVPHIIVSDISCFGNSDGFLTIDSVSGGPGPYLYSFEGGPFTTQNQFTNLGPGMYSVVIMDGNGCESTVELNPVTEPQEVTVEISGNFEGNDPIINLGESVVLNIITTPPIPELDTIIWSSGGLDSCAWCPQITVNPTEQTSYSVTVEKDGCPDSDKLTVFVKRDHPVFVPNAFSPNDDGINDIFGVYGNPKIAKVKSFLVFNRWGETVFEWYNFVPEVSVISIGWNGKHRGDFMDPGVFTWFAEIEFIDGEVEVFEGDVSLVR